MAKDRSDVTGNISAVPEKALDVSCDISAMPAGGLDVTVT